MAIRRLQVSRVEQGISTLTWSLLRTKIWTRATHSRPRFSGKLSSPVTTWSTEHSRHPCHAIRCYPAEISLEVRIRTRVCMCVRAARATYLAQKLSPLLELPSPGLHPFSPFFVSPPPLLAGSVCLPRYLPSTQLPPSLFLPQPFHWLHCMPMLSLP